MHNNPNIWWCLRDLPHKIRTWNWLHRPKTGSPGHICQLGQPLLSANITNLHLHQEMQPLLYSNGCQQVYTLWVSFTFQKEELINIFIETLKQFHLKRKKGADSLNLGGKTSKLVGETRPSDFRRIDILLEIFFFFFFWFMFILHKLQEKT